MRRWHAVPVAVLVALATAVGLFSAVAPHAEAGDPATYTLSVDCNPATPAVDSACTLPAGTASVTVDIVLESGAGAAAVDLAAFTLNVLAPEEAFDPVVPAGAVVPLEWNPDFNNADLVVAGSDWACSPPNPSPDNNADGGIANSILGCFSGTLVGPTLSPGGSLVLASIEYDIPLDDTEGTIQLALSDAGDPDGTPFVSCPEAPAADLCNDAEITVGTGGVIATPTSIAATATPCVTGCPATATRTSLAFVTITPTPGGETATPVPGEPTTAPGGEPPPGGQPPVGGAPGGGAGAGGQNPIRLPDTGANDGSAIDWSSMSLVALLALVAGTLAGGTYYYAARRVTARGRDE